MRASEIQDMLLKHDMGWIDRENTVDTFKTGDPETEVSAVAVGWMSTKRALKRAVELGCNVFITHEPTFFDGEDDHIPSERSQFAVKAADTKRNWIQDHKMVILRCHDLWDRYPRKGIPDSWGRQLGFADSDDHLNTDDGLFRVYELDEQPARSIAKRIARNVSTLGQEAVQLVGPGDAPVARVAIGTGAITPYERLVDEYNADLVVCSDDGFVYWRDGALAIDTKVPAVVVNHATSELHGMELLAAHLDDTLDVPIHHIDQVCMYELIEG